MDFENQYLSYEEYVGLGGSLDRTPFNILELEARKNVDKYTSGRLKNLDVQINEVKICIFNLINLLNSYNSKQNTNKAISSENIDGYSVTYEKGNDTIKSKTTEIKDIIKTYLAECYLADGTPYLYVGGVKVDNRWKYNLL